MKISHLIPSVIVFSIGLIYGWQTENLFLGYTFFGALLGVGNCILLNSITHDVKGGLDE